MKLPLIILLIMVLITIFFAAVMIPLRPAAVVVAPC